jgi:hypothetical protein
MSQPFRICVAFAELRGFAAKNSHAVENDRELCAVDAVKLFWERRAFSTLRDIPGGQQNAVAQTSCVLSLLGIDLLRSNCPNQYAEIEDLIVSG